MSHRMEKEEVRNESSILFSLQSSMGGDTVQRPPKRFIDTSPRKTMKRKKKEKMGKMASFIFFDIESTGLFKDSYQERMKLDDPEKIATELHRYTVVTPQSSRPHMTEISFVCVTRNSFESAVERMKKKASEATPTNNPDIRQSIPSNIHTRQLYPKLLTEDEWKHYENIRRPETLRLTRSVLSEKCTFSEEWPALRHVLQTAPKPTCIVAHNGLYFDLRVLHAELERSNLLEDGWLPDDVFFIDSLIAFREIDATDTSHISSLVNGIDWSAMSLIRAPGLINIPQSINEEDDIVEETPDELNTTIGVVNHNTNLPSTSFITPDKKPRSVGTASAPAKLNSSRVLFPEVSFDPCHPLNFLKSEEWTIAKRKRIQKRLFKKDMSGRWQYDANAVAEQMKKTGLFRQDRIYESIFNDNYMAHQAQDDCEALMQISLAYGQSFLEYADTMAADIIY